MKKLLVLAAFFGVLNAELLRVATAPNYPPYEYIENNTLTGYDVDIIKEIAKRNGYEVEFKYMEFDSLIPMLKSKKVDLIGALMRKTPLRAKAVDFSIEFKDSSNYVLHRKGSKPVENVEHCVDDDFKRTNFGVEIGSIQYDIAKKISKITPKGYSDSAISVLSLKKKHVDAIILDQAAANSFLEKNPELEILCEYKDPDPQGFAVNKGNIKLLEMIDLTLQEMIKDGTIEALGKKYKIL